MFLPKICLLLSLINTNFGYFFGFKNIKTFTQQEYTECKNIEQQIVNMNLENIVQEKITQDIPHLMNAFKKLSLEDQNNVMNELYFILQAIAYQLTNQQNESTCEFVKSQNHIDFVEYFKKLSDIVLFEGPDSEEDLISISLKYAQSPETIITDDHMTFLKISICLHYNIQAIFTFYEHLYNYLEKTNKSVLDNTNKMTSTTQQYLPTRTELEEWIINTTPSEEQRTANMVEMVFRIILRY